jgi:hypothetical protein
MRILLHLIVALGLSSSLHSAENTNSYLWVWLPNLDGDWKNFVDFAAEWKCTGVVIWGLQGWSREEATTARGNEALCRELAVYAHARGVKVIHGIGLNGYDEGRHICRTLPAANAVIPEKLRNTTKGRESLGTIFCPSHPDASKLLAEMLLRAADTGIDGFNFETADVDYITCHCAACQKRFQNTSETEHENKPPRWSIDQANSAIDLLARERPGLSLSIEFAMQRFGSPPYLDSAVISQINREIDERATVVWAEGTYPPQPICEKLAAERRNIGFYVRSAEMMGKGGPETIRAGDIIGTMRRLQSLHPKTLMYRSWRPTERWAVNMAIAAEAMADATRADAVFATIERRAREMAAPGGTYSRIRRLVPGNLASSAEAPLVTCSNEDGGLHTLVGLTDGVAEPDRGMWLTERTRPKEAWAEIHWAKPQRIARVRVFHQADGHYRSLDYVIESRQGSEWHPIEGMPVIDNKVHGWSEHRFAPLTTDRIRIRITRAMHGNRLGIGELEVYRD